MLNLVSCVPICLQKPALIDLQMDNYMKKLEVAIQHGLPVILQNVHEKLDPSLDPILNKAIVKIGIYYRTWLCVCILYFNYTHL